MQITSIEYSEYDGEPPQWGLEKMPLQRCNLVVGVNSSGKTRALNVIASLANIVSGRPRNNFLTGTYRATFFDDEVGVETYYSIQFGVKGVEAEELKVGPDQRMTRNAQGEGWLYADSEQRAINFKVPLDQVVVLSRRDSLQHPYLEKLFEWGNSLKHLRFGTELGQSTFSVFGSGVELGSMRWAHIDSSTAVYYRAHKEFKDSYKQKVLDDLASIGYDCEDIGLAPWVQFESPQIVSAVGLFVKEKGLPGPTMQPYMSTGMYRALAIIVAINVAAFSSDLESILIDDIGEGLDFERSRRLIALLVERAELHSFQLVMTTNDRFVMNAIPLKYWTVLHRVGNVVKAVNEANAGGRFQDFEFLGLNNFDFFSGKHFLGKGE